MDLKKRMNIYIHILINSGSFYKLSFSKSNKMRTLFRCYLLAFEVTPLRWGYHFSRAKVPWRTVVRHFAVLHRLLVCIRVRQISTCGFSAMESPNMMIVPGRKGFGLRKKNTHSTAALRMDYLGMKNSNLRGDCHPSLSGIVDSCWFWLN